MREIKFRAWSKTEKQFHYFTLANILQNEIEFQRHIINGTEFQQFTELRDKNGKEIYEGDVGRIDLLTFIVEYKDGAFWKVWADTEGIYADTISLLKMVRDVEIIGNVFENPELLEGWKCTN